MKATNIIQFPSRPKTSIPSSWYPVDLSDRMADVIGTVAKRFADGDRLRVQGYTRPGHNVNSPAYVVADVEGPGFTVYAYNSKSSRIQKLELPYE